MTCISALEMDIIIIEKKKKEKRKNKIQKKSKIKKRMKLQNIKKNENILFLPNKRIRI